MSGFSGLRSFAVSLLLAVVSTTINTASARQVAKKPTQRPVPAVAVAAFPTATAKFFTINEVLARKDALRGTVSATVHLASATPAGAGTAETGRHSLRHDEPFGLFTFRAPEGLLWVKWRGMKQNLRAEIAEITRCRSDSETCSPAARKFLAITGNVQAAQGRTRIEIVNRAVNSAIRYTSDFAQHRAADVWTTPLATLAAGRGDCEDYAIAKYAILREAGVPVDDLRLLLVRDRAVGQDHAVLAVRDGGRWLILDNRHLMLVETKTLPQFTPLFALDHEGVKLFAAPYAARPAPDVRVETVPMPATEHDQVTSAVAPTTPYLL
jgi:predicted transglutaminase-like cysteine proteinase